MKNKKWKDIFDAINNDKQHPDEHIFLCDGTNTFIRNFTAINHLNVNGHHIGGLTGFLKSLGYGIRLHQPTKVIVLFDGEGNSNSKKNLFADYKGNRAAGKGKIMNKKMFTDKEEEETSMADQTGRLMDYLDTLPVSLICIDGIEADDVMGYLVDQYENNPNTKKITLMSADRDFLQLVSKKTHVYSPSKKITYDVKRFIEEFGIYPQNYLLYKTFLGDKGDNVPKIKSFGEDKLFKLIPEFTESHQLELDVLLENINPEDPWGAKVLAFSHQLQLNYQLMSLKDVVLTPGDEIEVRESINFKNPLRKYEFLQMYELDMLGNSIPYVNQWVTDTFGYLSTFQN